MRFKAHEHRVKTINLVKMQKFFIIISASSDGKVKIWNLISLLMKQDEKSENLTFEKFLPEYEI